MLARSLLVTLQITLLSIASTVAMAQQHSRPHGSKAAPESNICAVTHSSGSGHNETKYCVTVNGNIAQFSRGGEEYIAVGDVYEGYGICDSSTDTAYFDYLEFRSDNWSPATLMADGKKAISTRTTSDGIWQITNTITVGLANASGPGSAKVTMQIKNLTSTSRNVVLVRYADMDYSLGGNDDFDLDFDYTPDTAIGIAPLFRSGLSLVNNTFNFDHLAFAQGTFLGPNPCRPLDSLASQPFVGDGSFVQAYAIAVPKNSTKTVVVTYKPI